MSQPSDVTFVEKYYGQLIGGTIKKLTTKEDEEGLWPTLHVEMPDGTVYKLEVSRDEEGNGPGFLFGLPQVRA